MQVKQIKSRWSLLISEKDLKERFCAETQGSLQFHRSGHKKPLLNHMNLMTRCYQHLKDQHGRNREIFQASYFVQTS